MIPKHLAVYPVGQGDHQGVEAGDRGDGDEGLVFYFAILPMVYTH
jgi:hypothetical protein